VIEDNVRRYLDAVDRYREFSDGLGPQSNSGPPFAGNRFRLMVKDGEPVECDPVAQDEGPAS
jgi:hypothetical protein